jgi:L-alanine-DL-glutamate epimerase-like enolase superfamily enzyme
MEVTDLKIYHGVFPLPAPLGTPNRGITRDRRFTLALIETDEDITGFAAGPEGGRGILTRTFKPLLIGMDPFDIGRVTPHLKNISRASFPCPWMIEIALWDVLGKACGQPIHKLLGARRVRIPAYLSTYTVYSPRDAAEKALGYLEEGFKAIKLRIHFLKMEEDIAMVAAVRDAVGDEMQIMVDANQANAVNPPIWTWTRAFKTARALEKLEVSWLEEPLWWEELDGLTRLCSEVEIPISGGEMERGLLRFKEIIGKHAYDIIQPDVGLSGGIMETWKIATLAEAHSIPCVPHSYSVGLGLGFAANLQLAGAISLCDWVEYAHEPPGYSVEVRDSILKEPIFARDGEVEILNKPGLGVELAEGFLQKYAVLEE